MKLLPIAALFGTLTFVEGAQPQPRVSVTVGKELAWDSQEGKTYRVQWTKSQTGDHWNDLTDASSGTGSEQSMIDEGYRGRTYRILETTPASPGELEALANGGFEAGVDGLDGWKASGGIHARESADRYSGSYSHRVQIENAGDDPGHGLLVQQAGVAGGEVTPGGIYRFQFRAKQLPRTSSYVQFYDIEWLDSNGETLSSTGYLPFAGGDEQWQLVKSADLTAPATAADVRVVFYFATGAISGERGGVLLDDISLATQAPPESGTGTSKEVPLREQDVAIFSWISKSGTDYRPQISSDLSADGWQQLPVVRGDGDTKTLVVDRSGSKSFFRLGYDENTTPPPPPPPGNIEPLFGPATILEPDLRVDTGDALVTFLGDRARDRHAREDIVGGVIFRKYDHFLPFYWEQRVADIEIIDRVAKGGEGIKFKFSTRAKLNPAEFRTFYANDEFVAMYLNNKSDRSGAAGVSLVSTSPSLLYPGETDYNYEAEIRTKMPENRPLQAGDRVEVELSQFLLEPRNGRTNYYGTAFLYVVGQGVVPWYAKHKEEATSSQAREEASFDSYPLPAEAWLGGETTLPYQYSNEPEHRFKQTAGNITPRNARDFMLGRRLHHTNFSDGTHSERGNPPMSEHIGKVGHGYVAQSCVACHVNNGRSLPPAIGEPLIRSIVKVAGDAAGSPHPVLGDQLQPLSTTDEDEGNVTIVRWEEIPGTYGDGSAYSLRRPVYSFTGETPEYFSVRSAPPLIGLGLLEAVPESTIASLADPNDVNLDGISGRMAKVIDPRDSGQTRLGRFNSKGGQARVEDQIAIAFNRDMGVSSDIFPLLDGDSNPTPAEITSSELDQLSRYVSLLGVSAKRELSDSIVRHGQQLFASASCASCHVPELTTSNYHPVAELRGQTIRPYTDLLLHDMGPGLADNLNEPTASGSEWRTAPLWNIGLTAGVSGGEAYLHDGRARTLEEAILWHGGEAEEAKENFRRMSASDREALVKFLKSL